MMKELILAIESSCDDSCIAIMDTQNFELLEHLKISQELQHSKYGGVVPELAARLHTKALPDLLCKIQPYFQDIKAICVTNEPGLSVSLVTGISMAKSLSIALKIPLIAINHLLGHIYSLFLGTNSRFPLGILLVSGGHTMVLNIDENAEISLLASTSDDSFGESFDKVAKMMNFGYPGGKIIEEMAKNGREKYKFTTPLLHDKRLEYSFSGLKNQVRIAINELENPSQQDFCDIARAFQNTAVLHICDKLNKIFQIYKFKRFGVVGGASANAFLRSKILEICDKFECELLLTPLEFCSDNAAMIARAGVEKYKKKEFCDINSLQLNTKSTIF